MKKVTDTIATAVAILMMAYVGILCGTWSGINLSLWCIAYFTHMLIFSGKLAIIIWATKNGFKPGVEKNVVIGTIELALFTYTSGPWAIGAVVGGLIVGTTIICKAVKSDKEE